MHRTVDYLHKNWGSIGITIGVLSALIVAGLVFLLREENAECYAAEDRAQLFGDPSVIQKLAKDGWRETFPDEGEAWLARHAIPGKLCDCPNEGMWRPEIADALMARKDTPLAMGEADSDELKKMKRMVNGMKKEFSAYVQISPSDAIDYINKACERCRVENATLPQSE